MIHDFLKPIYSIHIFFTLYLQLFHHCFVKILGQLLKVSTSFSFDVAMNVSASIFILFPADASIMESNNLLSIVTPTIGAMILICGFLFVTTCICYHVMTRRKKALKKKKRVSEHMAIASDTWRSERTFGLLHTFKDVIV